MKSMNLKKNYSKQNSFHCTVVHKDFYVHLYDIIIVSCINVSEFPFCFYAAISIYDDLQLNIWHAKAAILFFYTKEIRRDTGIFT